MHKKELPDVWTENEKRLMAARELRRAERWESIKTGVLVIGATIFCLMVTVLIMSPCIILAVAAYQWAAQ